MNCGFDAAVAAGLSQTEAKKAAKKAAEAAVAALKNNLKAELTDELQELIEEAIAQELLKEQSHAFLGFIEFPHDREYPIAHSAPFPAKVKSVLYTMQGAGTVEFSHLVNATIPENTRVTLTVAGADETTQDLEYAVVIEREEV